MVVEDMETDSGETVEHKLRRLLHIGTSSASIQLQGGFKRTGSNYGLNQASIAGIHKIELIGLSELLEPPAGSGLTNLALQHVKKALETNVLADKRAVYLILSAILKINCKQTKTEVYKILTDLIDTPEDLFEFVFYHKKVFPKRPGGMGSGMRRVLKNWYLKQDPFDLALEVSRVRSRHQWNHADLIKLCRVSSKDAGLDVVLASLVRGTKKTEEKYKDNLAAQPILEYLTCVRDINKCHDEEKAIELIDKHSFDMESVPTHLRRYSRIWEHALARMPLRGVLSNLRTMASNNFLSSEDAPLLPKLVNILRDPILLRASNLDPLEILVILGQAEAGWKLPDRGVLIHKEPVKKRVPHHTLHASVLQELRNMLATSLTIVPKMSPLTMVVCVDTRSSLTDESFGCWALSISRSLSVTLLSLLHAGADIRLVSMAPESFPPIPLSVGDTIEAVTARLEALPRSGQTIDPSKLLTWVRQTQGKVDLVLLATHSTNPVEDRIGLWVQMEQFRADENNVKFVYWALHSKKVHPGIRNPGNPNMLDIAGFSSDVRRILQACAKDCF